MYKVYIYIYAYIYNAYIYVCTMYMYICIYIYIQFIYILYFHCFSMFFPCVTSLPQAQVRCFIHRGVLRLFVDNAGGEDAGGQSGARLQAWAADDGHL